MSARLIAVVAPSGAGKDTLMAGAVAARPDLHWARRVITRPEAAGGEPFEGVSREVFDARRAAGEFAVWWPAHGLLYGVPTTIEAELAKGRTVLFNGSRAAMADCRRRYPALGVILIDAPKEVLAARLAARGRETADDIARRLARQAPPPDGAAVVRNDGAVDVGVARMLAAISRLEAGA